MASGSDMEKAGYQRPINKFIILLRVFAIEYCNSCIQYLHFALTLVTFAKIRKG